MVKNNISISLILFFNTLFGQVTFSEHVVSDTVKNAFSVFAVDVDGDGDTDILSANLADSKIVWYENDGNENFTEHLISNSAISANSVYSADVDGDGNMDVLSSSGNDDKIAWYENDGNESFTERVISTSADAAHDVHAADVDGDGDMDVLSASRYDDKVSWYENDGNESFTERVISTSADAANDVHAADIDGDGDMDVLSASRGDNKIAWYENDGSESFTEHVISTSATHAMSVHAEDIDGDGDMDVLSAAYSDKEIAWWENDGNESFTKNVLSNTANGAYCVDAADINNDGNMDVLSAAARGGYISWFENDGNKNFTEHKINTGETTANTVSVYAADVDSDGNMDLLAAIEYDNKIAWYEHSEPINTYVPDDNFEQALIDLGYDTTLDDSVLTENISSLTTLDVSGKEISNLTGIEAFTALTILKINTNKLTSVDLSKNTDLIELYAKSNELTSLDVSKNTALTILYLHNNQLTSLDVSKNIALTTLYCGHNQLTSLDISKNTALTDLRSNSNQLTSLDVGKNTALIELHCSNNKLTTLDLSKNTVLSKLYCHSNQLPSLDLSKNTALTTLDLNNNTVLTTVDLSKNTALTVLKIQTNKLTSLDVRKNTALTQLYCGYNQLTSLDVRKNTDLMVLYAAGNSDLTCIETLDPTYANTIWTSANGNIDAGVTFSYSCVVDGVSSYNNNGIKAITFNVELPTHSLPDTNISLSFWKSGAENHECTGCNGRDTVSMRKLSEDNWEATVELDTTLVADGVTGESQYWYNYFKTIPDYKITEDLERFKLETNPDGLRELKPGWHKGTSLVNIDTVIAWNNIAPGSFDWLSAASDTINISQSNLTDTYALKWSESKDVDIDTINYLISAGVGQFPAEIVYETADTSLMIYYQNIIDNWPPDLAMLSRGTLKLSVSATDGFDTVKVSGNDRLVFVNRYDYLSIVDEGIPTEFTLHENYPNPFNPTTSLRFDLPEVTDATITIFNMLGQRVRTFNMNDTPAGYHSIQWDATNDYGDPVGAGVYLYQLKANQFVKTRKMVLLK